MPLVVFVQCRGSSLVSLIGRKQNVRRINFNLVDFVLDLGYF